MSSNRKALKVLSLVQVIIAIAAAVLGVIILTGAGRADEDAGLLGALVVNADGILYLICAVLTFIVAAMGIRGANRPSSLSGHRALSVLTLVVAVATGVLAGLDREIPVLAALVALAALAAAVLDTKVRKELDR